MGRSGLLRVALCCSAVRCHLCAGVTGSIRFSGRSRNYSTLLLEEEVGLLFVGGRGAVYALNSSNISSSTKPPVSPSSSLLT